MRAWNVPFDILPDYSGELLEISHCATFTVRTKTFKDRLDISTPLKVIMCYSDGLASPAPLKESNKGDDPDANNTQQPNERMSSSTVNMSDSTSFEEFNIISHRLRTETTFTFLSMQATLDENEKQQVS